jgi:hypothetical protein
MKRRGFLQLLGLAPAVAILPAVAKAAERKIGMAPELGMGYDRVMTATEVEVLNTTRFFYRPDIDRWMGYATCGNVVLGKQYDYAELYWAEPTKEQRIQFHEHALMAMKRAKRKYG